MAKKKVGRPVTSERTDVSVKFDRTLAGKVRMIATGKGVGMAEYLAAITKATIDRDYLKLMEDLAKGE